MFQACRTLRLDAELAWWSSNTFRLPIADDDETYKRGLEVIRLLSVHALKVIPKISINCQTWLPKAELLVDLKEHVVTLTVYGDMVHIVEDRLEDVTKWRRRVVGKSCEWRRDLHPFLLDLRCAGMLTSDRSFGREALVDLYGWIYGLVQKSAVDLGWLQYLENEG